MRVTSHRRWLVALIVELFEEGRIYDVIIVRNSSIMITYTCEAVECMEGHYVLREVCLKTRTN